MDFVDCKVIRQSMLDEAKERISKINDKLTLVIIQVEGDSASDVYIRNKVKTCEQVGITPIVEKCPADISYQELVRVLMKYVYEDYVTGLMLQLPLPEHLKPYGQDILNLICWKKDVDGLSVASVGRLWTNQDCITPATPTGIMRLMPGNDLSGWNVTIINRSALVGKPLAKMLMDRNATVSICHSRTGKSNIVKHMKYADCVVVGIGEPKKIDKSYHPEDSGVVRWIDVGINRDEDGKICGDINAKDFEDITWARITPVPGGVGLLTTAQLMLNVIKAYELQHQV